MRKLVFFAFFYCLFPYFLNAQKLPKGIDKALAAQEKARKATEKVDFAKGRRKNPTATNTSYGSNTQKHPASNRDILRRINDRINASMSQEKQASPVKKSNTTDFEFGSSKKVMNNNKKN